MAIHILNELHILQNGHRHNGPAYSSVYTLLGICAVGCVHMFFDVYSLTQCTLHPTFTWKVEFELNSGVSSDGNHSKGELVIQSRKKSGKRESNFTNPLGTMTNTLSNLLNS